MTHGQIRRHDESLESESMLGSPIRGVVLAAIGLLLVVAAPGCGASVAGSNPAGIWFDEPFIGGWNEAEVAAKHCAAFGKTAVLRGQLLTDSRYTTPITAYDCQ
ncbi:MAG: hypothetical protein U1E42_00630 [Rhodospirillales bacterium]